MKNLNKISLIVSMVALIVSMVNRIMVLNINNQNSNLTSKKIIQDNKPNNKEITYRTKTIKSSQEEVIINPNERLTLKFPKSVIYTKMHDMKFANVDPHFDLNKVSTKRITLTKGHSNEKTTDFVVKTKDGKSYLIKLKYAKEE